MEILGTNFDTEIIIPETEVHKCGICNGIFNRSVIATHFFECVKDRVKQPAGNHVARPLSSNNKSTSLTKQNDDAVT